MPADCRSRFDEAHTAARELNGVCGRGRRGKMHHRSLMFVVVCWSANVERTRREIGGDRRFGREGRASGFFDGREQYRSTMHLHLATHSTATVTFCHMLSSAVTCS